MAKKEIGVTFSTVGLQDLPQGFIEALQAIDEEVTAEATKKFMQGGFSPSSKIETFREVVDKITPALVLISYSDAKKELEKYLKEAVDKDRRAPQVKEKLSGITKEEVTEEIIERNAIGAEIGRKKVTVIKSVSSDVGSDEIVQKVISAIIGAVNTYSSGVTEDSYKNIIQSIVTTAQVSGAQSLNRLNKTSVFKIQEKVGTNIDAAFVYMDFNAASSGIGDAIRDSIIGVLGKLDLNRILDLGHIAAKTQIDPDTEQYYGNFPKLTQVLFEKVVNSSISISSAPATQALDVNDMLIDFLNETTQIKNTLDVDKDFSENFLSVFVKIGGQVTKLENAVINQARGRAEERAYPGAVSREALAVFRQKLNKLLEQWNDTTQRLKAQRIQKLFKQNIDVVKRGKGSPSMLDYIAASIVASLSGKKVSPFTEKRKNTADFIPVKKTTTVKKSVKPKPKTAKLKLPTISVPQIKKKPIVKSEINLAKLLLQINGNLQEQIRKNMGTGDRRDVLNYRTGRFAGSARVERLSESRQGMITAFYSYMKNPYATFSRGGLQERPYTRDPKLLISKSIRELAGPLVSNRMRAVLV